MYPNTVKLSGSFSSTSRSAIGGLINAQVRGTPGRLALLNPLVAGNMLLGEVQRHLDQGALAGSGPPGSRRGSRPGQPPGASLSVAAADPQSGGAALHGNLTLLLQLLP